MLQVGGEGYIQTLLLGNFSGLGVAGVSLEMLVAPCFLFLMEQSLKLQARRRNIITIGCSCNLGRKGGILLLLAALAIADARYEMQLLLQRWGQRRSKKMVLVVAAAEQ